MKTLLGWVGKIVLGLVAAVVVVVLCLYGLGYGKLHRRPTNPVPAVTVPMDSLSLARGERLALLLCATCHGAASQFPLSGGAENFAQIPKGPNLGVLYAPNLMPGGILSRYSDGQLARAIREGVGNDGRIFIVMPSPQFHSMSDEDLGAVIAYLRRQPPVAHEVPARNVNFLAHILLGAGVFDTALQPPLVAPVPAVASDTTVAYGSYLTRLLACRDCHGTDLHGAPKNSLAPHGADLATLVPAHMPAEFSRALRQGIGFDGRPLDPTQMPWPQFSRLNDAETRAIDFYLRSGLPAGAR